MQSDEGLHCPLIELLDTIVSINGEQVQDDLNLRILRMLEGTFPLDFKVTEWGSGLNEQNKLSVSNISTRYSYL